MLLRELSGRDRLEELRSRYSRMLPLAAKEVALMTFHARLEVPGLTVYEPVGSGDGDGDGDGDDILLARQYSDVSPTELNLHVFCRDDPAEREKVGVPGRRTHACATFPYTLHHAGFSFPTNIAGVNLVMGCSKVFFFHCSNSCPGVLTLYK